MPILSTVNAIPIMTSNTAPSGVASSSSQTSSNEAFKAFDNLSNTYWRQSLNTATYPEWIQYEFSSPKTIYKYEITITTDITFTPSSWQFQGSDNGSQWAVIDSRTGITWASSEKKTFEIQNHTTPYKYYRLNVTGGGNHVRIAEIAMYETILLKRMALKNNSNLYSLDNKTLIHLPSSSDKNMILHGIESGKEIKLDEDFDKMKFVQDTSEVLGSGKTFTHAVDMSNTKVNKIIL